VGGAEATCGGLVGGAEATCGGLVGGVEATCGGLVGGVEAPCGGLEGGVCRCSVSTWSDPRLLVLAPDSSSETVGVDVLEFSEWSLVDGPPTPRCLFKDFLMKRFCCCLSSFGISSWCSQNLSE